MICPGCGKWNKASLPHCIYCGKELAADQAGGVPPWQDQLKEKSSAKSYIRVSEDGRTETTQDPRDTLAVEMAELKVRKNAGEQQQRVMRSRSREREQMNVRTSSNREQFFGDVSPDLDAVPLDQLTPMQQQPSWLNTDRYGRGLYDQNTGRRVIHNSAPTAEEVLHDGYMHQSEYYSDDDNYVDPRELEMRRHAAEIAKPPRMMAVRRIIRNVLIALAVCAVLFFGWKALSPLLIREDSYKPQPTVTATIRNDLAAHTVTIPGIEGQRITIRELRTSAIVVGGVATFDIMDHVWYDESEEYLGDTKSVTLTPFAITDSGKQTPLDLIHYDVEIPLSPITLTQPGSTYQVVATTLYNIVFYVRPGSTVKINGNDYSDLVGSEDGKVSYNATVQPIGNNEIQIDVWSQYCRKNQLVITLYREKQDIPLDLSSDIASTSSSANGTMKVKGTTLPGAVVKVLSPYVDLDITNTPSDGSFSFMAKFDHIGNNTIVITVDYPGRQTTRVEHIVYYVPNIDYYSRKAWDIVTQYTDLMDNLELRKSKSQIYVCKGTITSIESAKPQRAFMDVGTEESPLIIYVENSSKTTWEEGKSYTLYADAYGMYSSRPWLIARYTYSYKKK